MDSKAPVRGRVKVENVVERRIEELQAQAWTDGEVDVAEPYKFLSQCLNYNEAGDGIFFASITDNDFIFETRSGNWFRWNGNIYEIDLERLAAAAMRKVVEAYDKFYKYLESKVPANKKEGKDIDIRQKKIRRRIDRLLSIRGRANALQFACSNDIRSLAVRSDNFDGAADFIAALNCVISLRNGFERPGRKADLMTKQCLTKYLGCGEPAPVWEHMLDKIFSGDVSLIDYFRRLLGYGITGFSSEHVLPIFWGQGRNGKSTIIETLCNVLGPYVAPIQSELLLDQGRLAKNSSGPSPDIMALRGLRIAFASESDDGRRISPSKVKWLTGGDTLVGRNPHDKYEVSFRPSHLLILSTNHKPKAPADDFGFWERIHLIPFRRSFVDRDPQGPNEEKADKGLSEKLKVEAPGILAWLVRGCLEWQEMGLCPPKIVTDATAEYRRDEDILGDFITECCIFDRYAETQSSMLYDVFVTWWEKNVSKTALSNRKFGQLMKRRFECKRSSVVFYIGIRIKE